MFQTHSLKYSIRSQTAVRLFIGNGSSAILALSIQNTKSYTIIPAGNCWCQALPLAVVSLCDDGVFLQTNIKEQALD